MPTLRHKKILLGISGSIAAYKSAVLARLLMKQGAEVRVIMTSSASDFISPLTLHTLTRHPVVTDLVTDEAWNNHVELGLWADVMLIAPATANTLAKMANGLCDNLLTATYLSSKCPVMVAPAMDLDMWEHPATHRNLNRLKEDNVKVLPVGFGDLASGLVGNGRMAEPEEIISHLEAHFKDSQSLEGKQILVTAGPTFEDIDPVRYIGNRSSGKMGTALANRLSELGAQVHLVLGPVSSGLEIAPTVVVHHVQTADQMLEKCLHIYDKAIDAAIFSAAVSDYKPANAHPKKLKKENDQSVQLDFIPNPDIALELGKIKNKNSIHIGFALETQDGEIHAKDKLAKKNFDIIVLNYPGEKTGFQKDTNEVTLYFKDGTNKALPLMTKKNLSIYIIDELSSLLIKRN